MSNFVYYPSALSGIDVSDYKWVALTASIMMFHYTLTGFIAGGKRSKIFTEQFLKDNFQTIHERFYPEEGRQKMLPKGGYPDMGSGRYSEKLSYKEWYTFNNGQRMHYHYVEAVTSVVCWLLIAGILYPWVAIAFGALNVVARIAYNIGYQRWGPRGRPIGFLLHMFSATVLFILSFISAITLGTNGTWN